MSRSTKLAEAVCDADVIASETMQLYRVLGCPPSELRGIGLHMSQLQVRFLEISKLTRLTVRSEALLCRRSNLH